MDARPVPAAHLADDGRVRIRPYRVGRGEARDAACYSLLPGEL